MIQLTNHGFRGDSGEVSGSFLGRDGRGYSEHIVHICIPEFIGHNCSPSLASVLYRS